MGVGPTSNDSLFDRIAAELADADLGDATTEISRGESSRDESSRDDAAPGGIVLDGSGTWPAPDISTQMDRPILADRQCSRTGCSDVAAVTLSYHYGQSQVWIDYLFPEREPHMYDMCLRHAERLSVPLGWHLDDRRGVRHGGLIAV